MCVFSIGTSDLNSFGGSFYGLGSTLNNFQSAIFIGYGSSGEHAMLFSGEGGHYGTLFLAICKIRGQFTIMMTRSYLGGLKLYKIGLRQGVARALGDLRGARRRLFFIGFKVTCVSVGGFHATLGLARDLDRSVIGVVFGGHLLRRLFTYKIGSFTSGSQAISFSGHH